MYLYCVCLVDNFRSGFSVIYASQGSVVQRVDNAIQLIKYSPTNTFHLLESDLQYALDKVIPSLNNWGQICSQEYMYMSLNNFKTQDNS